MQIRVASQGILRSRSITSRTYVELSHSGPYDLSVASTTDPDKEVVRLARLVQSHLNHISYQIGAEIEAEPGSLAVVEQANTETGPAGKWGDVPPHTALSLAKLKLTASADHIASLHKLLQPPLTLFGLPVMARASLEASAKAFWVLDPALSVRQRVARELGDRAVSAEEGRKAFVLLIDEWKDPDPEAAVAQEAADLGVIPTKPPFMTTLVGEVLADHMESAARGEGLYKYLCAMAHTTNYATLQHFEEIGPSQDERSQLVKGRLGLEGVWGAVAATLAGHTSAVERMLDYLGRDKWAWDGWKNKIAQDLSESSKTFKTGKIQPVGRSPRPEGGYGAS